MIDVKRSRDGFKIIVSDDPKEILAFLEREVDKHREHMKKALDCALDCLIILQKTDEVSDLGVSVEPMFEHIEKVFDVTLTEKDRSALHKTLIESLSSWGGMSICHAWDLGHTIEHATWRG